MSVFNLLTEEDKDELELLANSILSNTEYCVIYEDSLWEDESEERQEQAYDYLITQISAVRDDK